MSEDILQKLNKQKEERGRVISFSHGKLNPLLAYNQYPLSLGRPFCLL